MSKPLSESAKYELYEWLKQQGVNCKNIYREFSDAVPMAYLLKRLFPKCVEVHNYPPSNSVRCKINNWETLNNKVLKNLNLQQSKTALNQIAKREPQALDRLLYKLMVMKKAAEKKHEPTPEEKQEIMWAQNDEILTIKVNKKVDNAIVKVPLKMILYSIYEDSMRELQARRNTLEIAEHKLKHFENMLELKSQRIEELTEHIKKMSDERRLGKKNANLHIMGFEI